MQVLRHHDPFLFLGVCFQGKKEGIRSIYSNGADDEGEMYPVARSSEEAVRDECGELI